MVSDTCRSVRGRRYKSAEKGTEKRGYHRPSFGATYDKNDQQGLNIYKKLIQKFINKTINKKHAI